MRSDLLEVVSILGNDFAQQIMCRKFNSFDPVDSPAYANVETIQLRTGRNERAEEQFLCPAISSRQRVDAPDVTPP